MDENINWDKELRENILGHFNFNTEVDIQPLVNMETKELFKVFWDELYKCHPEGKINIKHGLAMFAMAIAIKKFKWVDEVTGKINI